MLFVVYCKDKPDSEAVRAANRAAHLEYVSAHQDRILTAGPLLADGGEKMLGSLLILDFASRDELNVFLKDDPYAKADLFASVEIRPYRAAFPRK